MAIVNNKKVITISSVKGGVGKTTLVLNLAGVYAKMSKKVLIVDLDLYGGSIAASLNIDVKSDIYVLINDFINTRFQDIENYILKYNDFIDVIAAPKDPRYASKIDTKYMKPLLAKIISKYDIVLIDTNHTLDKNNLQVLDISDEMVFVLGNSLNDLKNMKTLVSIFKDMEKTNYKIVLNEAINKTSGYFSHYEVKNIIKKNIDYIIPNSFYIENIDKYVTDGEILTLNKKVARVHKKAMKTYEVLAKDLLVLKK